MTDSNNLLRNEVFTGYVPPFSPHAFAKRNLNQLYSDFEFCCATVPVGNNGIGIAVCSELVTFGGQFVTSIRFVTSTLQFEEVGSRPCVMRVFLVPLLHIPVTVLSVE